MTEPLFLKSAHLRALLDALPSMVFVIDRELRILDANSAAARLLGENPESILKRLCGDILHCIHARESLEGCGCTPYCKDCVVRASVKSAIQGQAVHRRRHRMRIQDGDEKRDVVFLITAAPFEYDNAVLSVVIFEDISQLMELRRLVPICSNCKKVRDDADFWHDVEVYMKKNMEIDFSHGICQTCRKKLYPEFL